MSFWSQRAVISNTQHKNLMYNTSRMAKRWLPFTPTVFSDKVFTFFSWSTIYFLSGALSSWKMNEKKKCRWAPCHTEKKQKSIVWIPSRIDNIVSIISAQRKKKRNDEQGKTKFPCKITNFTPFHRTRCTDKNSSFEGNLMMTENILTHQNM